jgi:hypothetical protein
MKEYKKAIDVSKEGLNLAKQHNLEPKIVEEFNHSIVANSFKLQLQTNGVIAYKYLQEELNNDSLIVNDYSFYYSMLEDGNLGEDDKFKLMEMFLKTKLDNATKIRLLSRTADYHASKNDFAKAIDYCEQALEIFKSDDSLVAGKAKIEKKLLALKEKGVIKQ